MSFIQPDDGPTPNEERIIYLEADLEIAHDKLKRILAIAENAPELNMNNYDVDQVAALNAAMIEIWEAAKAALQERGRRMQECSNPMCRHGKDCTCANPAHKEKYMTVEQIAKVCHEANRALCAGLGDFSQQPWEDAPEWQRTSAVNGVRFNLDNPDAPASASHDSWLAEKERDGWKYGPVKDADKKEHPCFVPYEELPKEQQAKDYLFKGVVAALAPLVK